MEEAKIRVAEMKDFPVVWELVQDCVASLLEMGLDQWSDFYPTQETIRSDIQNCQMYRLSSNGDLSGIITINEQQEPEYKSIHWKIRDIPILIVHRLMTAPAVWQKGIGMRLMEFAETYARNNGYRSIRLDAYSANPAAMSLYRKLEYQPTGQVWFKNRKFPFECFEKSISHHEEKKEYTGR